MSKTSSQSKPNPKKSLFPAKLPKTGYVRESQLIPGILPISHATLWQMVRDKRFPAPVKLSRNITAWDSASVRAWMAERAQGKNPEGQEPGAEAE
jgi:prophage regulatory protein